MTEPLKESVGASAAHTSTAAAWGAPADFVVRCSLCGRYHTTLTLIGGGSVEAFRSSCRHCRKSFTARDGRGVLGA